MAHKTVFAHNKGGTGKTTACINIAGFLSKKGKNVLVVDGDPQGNATSNLGLSDDYLDNTLYEALMTEAGLRDVDTSNCVYPTAYDLDLLPGSQKLHEAYQVLWEEDGRSEFFSEALWDLRDKYDHILIDTPSSHLSAVASGIRAADSFYMVMDHSLFSHEGTKTLKSFLRRLPDQHNVIMNPTRVLLTEHRQQSPLRQLRNKLLGREESSKAERVAKSLFGTRFTKIPYINHVITSQQEKVPLSHFENVPKKANIFDELADDLIEYSW